MLDIKLSKQLGDVIIDVEFATDTEGVIAIFGESGAGKTSIINMVSGLIKPDKGYIKYNNKVLFDSDNKINTPVHKRFIGYVFQESRLFPNISVRKNLLYGRKRIGDNSFHCDFDEVCSLLGISHLLDRYPSNLSGGEKQRVAIGRALLSNPEILLMDEPLASLDIDRRFELLEYINIIQRRYNIPILYVSHSIDEILRLADVAVYMNQGKLVHFGDTVEVLNSVRKNISKSHEMTTIFEGYVKNYNKDTKNCIIEFCAGSIQINLDTAEVNQRVRFSINVNEVVLSIDKPNLISIRNIYKGRVIKFVEDELGFYNIEINIGCSIMSRISSSAFLELGIDIDKELYVMIKSAVISENLKMVH